MLGVPGALLRLPGALLRLPGALLLLFGPDQDQPAVLVKEPQPDALFFQVFSPRNAQPQPQFFAPQPAVPAGFNRLIALLNQPPTFQPLLVGVVAKVFPRLEPPLVEVLLGS